MATRSPVGTSETLKEERGVISLSVPCQAALHLSLSITATKELLISGRQQPGRNTEQTVEMPPQPLSRVMLWGSRGSRALPTGLSSGGGGHPPLPDPAHDVKSKDMPRSVEV